MTEKLTEEERERLARLPLMAQIHAAEKAIRIIDAQAAALDRVRAARERYRADWTLKQMLDALDETLAAAPDAISDTDRLYETAVSPGEEERLRQHNPGRGIPTPGCKHCRLIAGLCGLCEAAAAPEHTALTTQERSAVDAEASGTLDSIVSKLDAANARVAELERLHEQALSERDAAHLSLESMTAGRDSALELAADISDQRDAANARVAELEESEARAVARAKDIEAECVRVERRVIAANARADAAKREMTEALTREQVWRDRADAAERSNREAWNRFTREKTQRLNAESDLADMKAKCEAAERALASNLPASYWKSKYEAVKRAESNRDEWKSKYEAANDIIDRLRNWREYIRGTFWSWDEFDQIVKGVSTSTSPTRDELWSRINVAASELAEWRAKCKAAEQAARSWAQRHDARLAYVKRAESEAAALRAEVDALQSEVQMLRDVGGGRVLTAPSDCSCRDELNDQPCPTHGQLFSPTDAEADALGLTRMLAPTERECIGCTEGFEPNHPCTRTCKGCIEGTEDRHTCDRAVIPPQTWVPPSGRGSSK